MIGNLYGQIQTTSQYNLAQKYVCKIEIANTKIDKNNKTILTGFLVKGQQKVITALHGFAGKIGTKEELSIKVTFFESNGNNQVYTNDKHAIVLTGTELANDMATISCPCFQKEGLEIGTLNDLAVNNEYHIYGYKGDRLHENAITLMSASFDKLHKLIQLPTRKDLETLKFPSLTTNAIEIPSANIFRGHSGSPMLNKKNKVVGMVDGFELDGVYGKTIAWAMPITKIPDKVYNHESAEYTSILNVSKVRKNAVMVGFGEELPLDSIQNYEVHSAIDFRHRLPFISVGGYLSKFYSLTNQTNNLENLNSFADLYIDFKINKALTLGAYATSSFIQYKLTKLWENDLKFIPTENTYRHQKLLDLYGIQTTWWWLRRVKTDAFVGAGIGIDNYRGFLGVRQYLGPRRILAIETKALFSQQAFSILTYIPQLGTARRETSNINLKNIHLCFGLNFSIGRK
ncbi:MAG: hypothetical protein ACOVO2_05395 [Emticicia sp.]|uniref:hypothetical protein n=1 Tax=Emticicia sp. TaxID=1930953 RepID=UPI003BA6B844